MKKIFKKIKSSLLLKFFVLLLIPGISFLVFYTTITYSYLKKEKEESTLNKLILTSYKASSKLSERMSFMSEILLHSIQDIRIMDTFDINVLRKVLTNVINKDTSIYGTGVFFKENAFNNDAENVYVYLYRGKNKINELNYKNNSNQHFDYKNYDWYINAINKIHDSWSKPYYDPLGKTYMVTYSTPIIVNNTIRGVFTIDLKLSNLVDITADYYEKSKIKKSKYKFLIISKHDKTIIYSHDNKFLGKNLNEAFKSDPALNLLAKEIDNLIDNEIDKDEISFKGTEYYIFYTPTQNTNWISISWVNSKSIDSLVIKTIRSNLIIITILFIFFLLIILFLVKRITKPILEMANVSLKIAEGDFSQKINIKSEDEIGVLAQSFNTMLEKLKEREESLTEAKDNLILLLDNLPFSVIRFNKQTKPIFLNKYFIEIIKKNNKNIDFEKIKEFNWGEAVNEKYLYQILNSFNGNITVVKGSDIFVDNSWIKNPYNGRYVEVYYIPVYIDNEVDSVLCIIFDMTEEKQNEELRIEVKSSELANKAKSEFLARMSHEIRTPLNAVIGFCDLSLRKYKKKDQVYEYLVKIKQSANHLLSIINDILDYSKIEAGKVEMETVEFNIESILLELFDLSVAMAHKKNLEFIISHSPLIPIPLYGDPVKLKQILFNLVSNAIKFTSEGEIYIDVDVKEETKDKIILLFKVKDTGIGMSDKALQNLFKPFVQADGSITRRFGGTGIGLTISKRFVELMNGEIWVESKEGEGSIFYFTAEFTKKGETSNFIEYFKKFNFTYNVKKLNTLICDDNKTSLLILRQILEAFGYKVDEADSGEEVVDKLEKGNNYDLLILDIVMPHPDGIETMEIINEKGLREKIKKVILLSSYDVIPDESKLKELKVDGFQKKPVSYSNLFDKIITIFNKDINKGLNYIKSIANFEEITFEVENNTILVVDDSELNREVINDLLEMIGFNTELAGNGFEAIEKIKNSGVPSKYCLVFMDIQMPEMDGYEATKIIRKIEDYKDLPIIAMTADVMPGIKEKCLAAGMNDYVTKPINPSLVALAIKTWVKGIKVKKKIKKRKTKERTLKYKFKHINQKEGVERIGGDLNKFINLICKFKDNYSDFSEKFHNIKNKEELHRYDHTFKGVTGNISAEKLHKLAVELESKLKKDEDYKEVLKNVEAELDNVIKEINEVCKEISVEKHSVKKMSKKELKYYAEKIITMLDESDPDVKNELDNIETLFNNRKEYENLKNLIDAYDFDGAIELIKKHIKNI